MSAPPCCLFGYLSISVHKRDKLGPEGDTWICCVFGFALLFYCFYVFAFAYNVC
jgi:hypothetical protein